MESHELLRMRRASKLTQAELAKRIGYSRKTIVSWERGVHPIPPHAVSAITGACVAVAADAKAATIADDALATLEAYTKSRRSGVTHADILRLWADKSFQPSPEAQAAIAAAYPDILAN